MLESWVPVLVFFILVAGFSTVSLILSYACGPKKPDARKLSPYECGMHPVGTARERFSVKFYLVAMLFLLFDIEAVFLFPWAVVYRELKLFASFGDRLDHVVLHASAAASGWQIPHYDLYKPIVPAARLR